MTRTLLLIVLALAGAVSLTAQDSKAVQTVTFPAPWTPGRTHTFEFTKQTKSNRAGVLIDATSTMPVVVRVIEKTETGFILEWTYEKAVIKFDGGSMDDLQAEVTRSTMDAMAKANEGIVLRFEADERGTPTKLLNKDEVNEAVKVRFARAMDEVVKSIPDPAVQRRVKGMLSMSARSVSADVIAAAVVDEATLLTVVAGRSYDLGEKYERDSSIMNPIMNRAMPCHVSTELTSIDVPNSEATLVSDVVLDGEKAKPILLDYIGKVMAQRGMKKPLTDADLPAVESVEHFEFRHSTRTGLAHKVTRVLKAAMGPMKTDETLTVRLKKTETAPPAPAAPPNR